MEDVAESSSRHTDDVRHRVQSEEIIKFADITFDVEGKELLANKTCLSMISPVFKSMFQRQFKEAYQTKIPLPSKSFLNFLEFINVTHIGASVDNSNVLKILPLAHEYCCEGLLQRCEQVLLTQPATMLLFAFASIYDLENLYKKCLNELVKQDFSRVQAHNQRNHYDDLDDKAKVEYLESRVRLVECENQELRKAKSILDEINVVVTTNMTKTVCSPAALVAFTKVDNIGWATFDQPITSTNLETTSDHLVGAKMISCKRCDTFRMLAITKLLGVDINSYPVTTNVSRK